MSAPPLADLQHVNPIHAKLRQILGNRQAGRQADTGTNCLQCMEEFLSRAHNTVRSLLAQDVIAGKNVGISSKLISLQITSYGIPDLTLIDLPGITRVAVEGQPQNIGEQVCYLSTQSFTL